MKIALPTAQGQVDSHFGHCAYFTIVEVNEQKQIINRQEIPAPDGCGCKSGIASVLKEMGVTVMLAGNMGDGAVSVLASNGITAIRGCAGTIDEVVSNYLLGKIVDSAISCHHECHH